MQRVVIAHDYLTQRGGAERVVLALLDAFPGARVVTSVYAVDRTYPEFRRHEIETLLPSRAPLIGRDPRYALPILATTFGRHVVGDADVVICSSSGWAHGIDSTAPKIVYCHTPARWLHAPTDYVHRSSLATRVGTALARRALAGWDRRAATSAALYVANSHTVADRIRRAYGIEARVVHPPSTLDPAAPSREVPDLEPGFFLTVGRSRGYKNTAAVVEAARLNGDRLIVVGGPHGLANVEDAQLRWLYAHSRALVAAAYEDFGLTPVEAMSFGKPVAALRAGGYLDTIVDGKTGVFFDAPSPDAIAAALRSLAATSFDEDAIRAHSRRFSREQFTTAMNAAVRKITG